MKNSLKAWAVSDCKHKADGKLLVFAYTRAQAKAEALPGPNGKWSIVHMAAERQQSHDAAADGIRVVKSDGELPAGFAPFYQARNEF